MFDKMINQDMCGCYYDFVDLDFIDGCVGISFFDVILCELFYYFNLVEWYFLGL